MVYRRLTFSLWLFWLREYVFNFLPFIGGWHSHYDWPGLGSTWFQFLIVHEQPTFIAQIVSNIRTVYLLLSLSPPRFVSIFKDRESLLFLLHTVTSAHSLVALPPARRYANFSWSKYLRIIHRLLVPGARQFYFALWKWFNRKCRNCLLSLSG